MSEPVSDHQPLNLKFLDFEQPIAELEAKIEDLRQIGDDSEINISDEISRLGERSRELTKQIFSKLNSWQIARLARHPLRPFTLDYVERLFDDISELHGDRSFSDDPAIVAGIGKFRGLGVAFIGHQKGRNTKQNLHRNFGMPRPEGYRKAMRIMQLAERFQLPVVTFVDTPGAYPGVGAEERGQSEAIARNLLVMASLRTPIVTTIIGEGGSGGALAIGVADQVFMLTYATYAVISPEGCAAILWKSPEKAAEAAEAMGITSRRLASLGLIDAIIDEPLGGAHRDIDATAQQLGEHLERSLAELMKLDPDTLLLKRRARYKNFGQYLEK
ncbi:MAG: acetyl-CoA carboxylase carboxyl transferase subunit alpha [Gammaproteobacteria bacterium]|jgi:acetyl-CoA carboxylase carboxyl transferase subunit alpha